MALFKSEIKNYCDFIKLHKAIINKDEHAFEEFLNEYSEAAINEAIAKENENGQTALHIAAQYQDYLKDEFAINAVFCKLLDKISDQATNVAAIKKDKHGWTAVCLAARYRTNDVFNKIFDKVSDEVLNQASMGFFLAAQYQSHDTFYKFINRISTKNIDKIFGFKDDTDSTILHLVAKHQSSKVFCFLINKTSHEVIDAKLAKIDKSGSTALGWAARLQSSEAFCALIDKVSAQSINDALVIEGIQEKVITALHLAAHYQSSEALLKLMNKINTSILNELARKTYSNAPNLIWLTLYYQSPSIVNQLIQRLDFNIFQQLIPVEHYEAFKTRYLPCFLHPSFKNIQDENKLKLLRSLYVDLQEETTPITSDNQSHNTIVEKIKEGNVLLKIIKIEHWNDSLKQLQDKNFRPHLRDPKKNETNVVSYLYPYKFDLSAGIVKERDPDKKVIEPTHIRKTSTTLLSPEMLTAVFGEHDPSRELVGLLLDGSYCEIKALWSIDTATHAKSWVAKKFDTAKEYGVSIQSHHFLPDNLPGFKKRIQDNPFIHNEVLAKIPYDKLKDVLLSIVIAKDTPLARAIARQRQRDVKHLLDIDLPIVFYNRYLGQVKPYLQSDMVNDGEKTKFEWIERYHLDLNKKENLDYWDAKTVLKFFGSGIPIVLNGQTYRVPAGVYTIMQVLKQYSHEPEIEFFKAIDQASKTMDFFTSLLEDKDTQAFYNKIQTRQYFGVK